MQEIVDLQTWFWQEMDVRGPRVVDSVARLLHDTPSADMAFVGLQACTMLYKAVALYGPRRTIQGVARSFKYMNVHASLAVHPAYHEAQIAMRKLLESFN
jgi:hypothetical protein